MRDLLSASPSEPVLARPVRPVLPVRPALPVRPGRPALPARPDRPARAAQPEAEDLSALPVGRFSGRRSFAQLLRAAFASAAREGWPEIFISDANFHDWPLGEREVADALQHWARSGRRMTMLACNYDAVVRQHPRFVRWRRTWEHIISCHRAACTDPQELPSALWSAHWVLQRHNVQRCVGASGCEPERRLLLRETLAEWVRSKSAPGFPATTLGL